MPGSDVTQQFDDGEVDLAAAPNLTDVSWECWEIQGLPVRVARAPEVITKHIYHRRNRATARGLFDLARVVEGEPDALAAAAPLPH